jgi:primosomal protein N''
METHEVRFFDHILSIHIHNFLSFSDMPAISEHLSFSQTRQSNSAPGENPNLYDQTRMDAQWNCRQVYNEAKKVKDDQDDFCHKVEAEDWNHSLIKINSQKVCNESLWSMS